MNSGLSASILARLQRLAKARGDEFQAILTKYGVERFLYRLSRTPAGDSLWLKGALLFDLWFDVPHRPTRDADFLAFGDPDVEALRETVAFACGVEVDDGMTFDPATIRAVEIREDARYGGLRVTLEGRLGRALCPVQLDVGYGDAVTPDPEFVVLPTLLDGLPPPRLHAYPRATVFAEKLEAIVSLGMANSRMKDYFDLRALAREGALDPDVLAQAIAATLARRRTPLPEGLPVGLTDEFALDPGKRQQWNAFLRRNRLEAPPLDAVVCEVRDFLDRPLRDAARRLHSR